MGAYTSARTCEACNKYTTKDASHFKRHVTKCFVRNGINTAETPSVERARTVPEVERSRSPTTIPVPPSVSVPQGNPAGNSLPNGTDRVQKHAYTSRSLQDERSQSSWRISQLSSAQLDADIKAQGLLVCQLQEELQFAKMEQERLISMKFAIRVRMA